MSDYYGRKGMPVVYFNGKSDINPDEKTTPAPMKKLSQSRPYRDSDFFREAPPPSRVSSNDILRANLFETDHPSTKNYFSDVRIQDREEKRKTVQFDLFSNKYDSLSDDGWARGQYAEATDNDRKMSRLCKLNDRSDFEVRLDNFTWT